MLEGFNSRRSTTNILPSGLISELKSCESSDDSLVCIGSDLKESPPQPQDMTLFSELLHGCRTLQNGSWNNRNHYRFTENKRSLLTDWFLRWIVLEDRK